MVRTCAKSCQAEGCEAPATAPQAASPQPHARSGLAPNPEPARKAPKPPVQPPPKPPVQPPPKRPVRPPPKPPVKPLAKASPDPNAQRGRKQPDYYSNLKSTDPACSDKDARCPGWAATGMCERGGFMLTTCAHSCGGCSSKGEASIKMKCEDYFPDCASMVRSPQACQTQFMQMNCKVTCSLCPAIKGSGAEPSKDEL